MKALSLWQPWASLVALGVKRTETRSWSTSYRGPLAIHATATMPPYDQRYVRGVSLFHANEHVGGWWAMSLHGNAALLAKEAGWPGFHAYGPQAPLVGGNYYCTLGAIVATCTLVDVVPMVGADGCKDAIKHLCIVNQSLLLHSRLDEPWPDGETEHIVSDQLPYGDFTPGRYAWLLADIKPVDPPVPCKGRQGLWNIPDDVAAEIMEQVAA